jgi:hypothetical protein
MVPAVAQVGAVLRLSRPTETTMAVRKATRRGRKPEIVMFVSPLRVVRLLGVT